MCNFWIGRYNHRVWHLYGRKCSVRMKGQRDVLKNKMTKMTIKICSERMDAERNTSLITSSLFPTIFQGAKRSISMYFSLFAKCCFPVGFPACIWGKVWILFLFKSKGEICNFRPGSERCWTVKGSLSDPILGRKRQERPGWIEKRHPQQSKHCFFYFYFL